LLSVRGFFIFTQHITNSMKPNIGQGDSGKTWIKGCQLDKTDPLIGLIGAIDELNSFVGLAQSVIEFDDVKEILKEIQNDLMRIGAWLGGFEKAAIDENYVKKLENFLLKIEGEIEPLKNFILPGGCMEASLLHVCRSVCRRVERKAFLVSKERNISQTILSYLNRLSDVFFEH